LEGGGEEGRRKIKHQQRWVKEEEGLCSSTTKRRGVRRLKSSLGEENQQGQELYEKIVGTPGIPQEQRAK